MYTYLQNFASIISGGFFFVSGSSNGNQGIGNVGVFYLFELPFFITGIIVYFKRKQSSLELFIGWLVINIFTLALSKEVPHATRGFFLVIPIVVLTALGFFYFINKILLVKSSFVKHITFSFLILFIFYCW